MAPQSAPWIFTRWKTIPINIYELLSEKWKLDDFKKDMVSRFASAIELYLSRDFEKALVIFEELSLLWDKPSVTYVSRCKLYILNTPENDWDWVWTMTEK